MSGHQPDTPRPSGLRKLTWVGAFPPGSSYGLRAVAVTRRSAGEIDGIAVENRTRYCA